MIIVLSMCFRASDDVGELARRGTLFEMKIAFLQNRPLDVPKAKWGTAERSKSLA